MSCFSNVNKKESTFLRYKNPEQQHQELLQMVLSLATLRKEVKDRQELSCGSMHWSYPRSFTAIFTLRKMCVSGIVLKESLRRDVTVGFTHWRSLFSMHLNVEEGLRSKRSGGHISRAFCKVETRKHSFSCLGMEIAVLAASTMQPLGLWQRTLKTKVEVICMIYARVRA